MDRCSSVATQAAKPGSPPAPHQFMGNAMDIEDYSRRTAESMRALSEDEMRAIALAQEAAMRPADSNRYGDGLRNIAPALFYQPENLAEIYQPKKKPSLLARLKNWLT